MNIKFENARILTMSEECQVFKGTLITSDSRIAYISEVKDGTEIIPLPTDIVIDRVVDCEGNLLLPGFKNAHAHSGMSPLRSIADDTPLAQWLNIQIFPREAKLTAEMIYDATQLSVLEYLTSGITACFDMYLTPDSIVKAYEDMGFRAVLCGNLNNFSSSVELTEEFYNKYNDYNPLISYEMGFHAEYTCSKELLTSFSEMIHKYNAPVYTHLNETESEVKECVDRYGMTPGKFLDSLGIFDFGGGCYHCVHMSDEDIDIFKKRGLSAITNPGSNTKLASGIAPISELMKQGINIGIGTDGPASNNCLDMFREMFLVTGLGKLREADASVVDAFEVLKMATVGSALAMRLFDCDVLEVGKQADIIMIDLNSPNMRPLNNIAKNIVYSGSKANIKMTMVAGNILYSDGRFADSIDVETIYRKTQEIADFIK